ncbi:C6 finger domain-containing protein [Pleurostoma richardsiae]|uniref:C6 finger domain-containing protein n=1 Tax=Pleurostoma richardsiae TaxID=41990 RepID=A0AA38VUD6_9PEZI|nr:C6 finger domain-containing protein [Pleurostoma richardsiae]
MTFDFNAAAAAAGGEAALLEQLGFDPRDRLPFTTTTLTASHPITAGPSSAIPTAAATASCSHTMAHSNRQSPGATWLPLDLAGGGGVGSVSSIHSPGSAAASASSPEEHQAQSPTTHFSSAASSPHQQQLSPFQTAAPPNPSAMLADWSFPPQQAPQQTQDMSQFIQDSALISFNPFAANMQPSPLDYLPATTQAALEASLQMEPTFSMSPVDETTQQAMQWGMGMANWQDFETAMQYQPDGLPRMGSMGSNSPTGTYLEVLSLNSGSDNGWATVDVYRPSYDSFPQSQQTPSAAIFNPGQTLHLRTSSDSSQSEGNSLEFGSYEEVPFPLSPFSGESDTYVDTTSHRNCFAGENHHHHSHEGVSPTTTTVAPVPIKATPSSRGSASGSGASASPPARRSSGPRKSPISKPTKSVIRRTSTGKKEGTGEKKVGRRRGPLLPEQRKQASEIRKLRACLRCKFLKKTCDKGEPCAGCQPSHARLWQVPCTRIDIKDVGYFMKDWKADYERHLGRGVSVYNVKGFAQKESLMWITHGYGFCLPVPVREVYVADDSCFQVDWVESHLQDQEPIDFEIRTEKLDVGQEGISMETLSEYLDKHIDGPFENFIDDHFEGTPFITEILKTAHRYYVKDKLPVIRKALKLVLAYNLTMHITMVEQAPTEQSLDGQIDDEDSKYYGRVVAPVMINFQIKCAMADMWRELQKDILEELSSLYSSVYSGDRLKNWPTIFMLASILLAVWEEMQFDCHYRVPDPAAVQKFCSDMETIPVGVIVGLFHAISQKLPAFTEWDTRRHGQLLNNNPAVCEAMTEVRQHVLKHEAYLRTRQDSKFDRYDFDSLSNKFLSKLVIRAN